LILHDVNVYVYAFRADVERHDAYREVFDQVVVSPNAFGYSPLVLSGFMRVVTNPRVFEVPASIEDAMDFVEALREQPNANEINPGPRHWGIFTDLCRTTGSKGNLVADAYHAALAIEAGCEWISTDRDYARFPGLRWRHPLD
jgi:toxin-antitoxin system PIN domain toxin